MNTNYFIEEKIEHQIIVYERPLMIVVPFYKNAEIVRVLFESLIACKDELKEINAELVFFNDSPECSSLSEELNWCSRNADTLVLNVVKNEENLGFVKTANKAFSMAIKGGKDILLLNSDTYVFPGSIKELRRVAELDSMIGFVNPRSNNATICTFPPRECQNGLNKFEDFNQFKRLMKFMDPISYVPTGVGFCLLIKNIILVEFGLFDEVYGEGYNEENDLIMRCNRFGYCVVLANHSYIWHQGEVSFNSTSNSRQERDQFNYKILVSRYPEYPTLIHNYFNSSVFYAEQLIGAAFKDEYIGICFDLSSFGTYHNGTFEAGKKILIECAKTWPVSIKISVCISKSAWMFHELNRIDNIQQLDIHDSSKRFAIIIRFGQPFDWGVLNRLIVRAPVIAIFMLDTIASDCGYLRIGFDNFIWGFLFQHSDIIFTNSTYTENQIKARFTLGERVKLHSILHSTSIEDYLGATIDEFRHNEKIFNSKNDEVETSIKRILIVGNNFKHKAIHETLKAIQEKLIDAEIIVLGAEGDHDETSRVRFYTSGYLSGAAINRLYYECDVVVFPSFYEGFGFPIMEALSRQRPIFVRNIPVFHEIKKLIELGGENIIIYKDTAELVQMLNVLPASPWTGPAAVGETDGWKRSADEILQVVLAKLDSVSSVSMTYRHEIFRRIIDNSHKHDVIAQIPRDFFNARSVVKYLLLNILKIKPRHLQFLRRN